MDFSFIIPAHNCEKTISYCIDSIIKTMNNTSFKYEIIVIENGSSDNTMEILNKYKKDIIISFSNKGVSKARNKGIEISSGKYLFFVDSDDCLIEEGIKEFEQDSKKYDLYCYSFIKGKFDDNDDVVKHDNNTFDKNNCLKWLMTKPTFRCQVWSKIFIRSIIIDNNLRFKEDLSYSEDSEFLLNYCNYIKKCKISNKVAYKYVLNQTSVMNNVPKNIAEEYKKSLLYTKEIYEESNIKKYFYRYVLAHLNIIMVRYVFNDKINIEFDRKKLMMNIMNEDLFKESLKNIKILDCLNYSMMPQLFMKLHMYNICSLLYRCKAYINKR